LYDARSRPNASKLRALLQGVHGAMKPQCTQMKGKGFS